MQDGFDAEVVAMALVSHAIPGCDVGKLFGSM